MNALPRQRVTLKELGLPAFIILLGMQTLRAVFPLLLYVLRDRFGWTAVQVGILAFVIFLAAFLVALLNRLLGLQRLLLISGVGLGLFRILLQLWSADPLVDLLLAIGATVCFILLLPAYLGAVRQNGAAATGRFAVGVLVGLALDTALHGLYGTYDMSWQTDWVSAVLVVLLTAIFWILLADVLRTRAEVLALAPRRPASDVSFRLASGWLTFGLFLFLQLIIFQNVARLTALSGWAQPAAFAWVLLGHTLGIGVAWQLLHISRRGRLGSAVLLAAFLVVSLVTTWPTGVSAALLFLIGQVSLAGLIALSVSSIGLGSQGQGLRHITISHGLGIFLMVLFSFIFYAGYDIRLPFGNGILPPLAAVLIGLAAVGGVSALNRAKAAGVVSWQPVLWVAMLFILPLVKVVTRPQPATVTGTGYPVRVMTYNLHNGFDPTGRLDMEAIAQAIERQQPDVVALQEVSRGWVVNGSLDMLTWLSERLDLPYVYGPTADPLWGNAILSRFPITSYELIALPPDDMLLARGFISVRIDLGNEQQLHLIDTHYHHVWDDSAIRVIQSEAILNFWQDEAQTVILGDLNATPEKPEILLLAQAGLTDVVAAAGLEPGLTSPADAPTRQIDYILFSPDLTAEQVLIMPETASDHLGIVATLRPVE